MPNPETIDQGTFDRFFDSLGRDVEFLNEVIEEFLASSPGLFASMQQAIAAGEAPVLQRAAHSLKTGSATFGALAFSTQCKELDNIGKSGVLDKAEVKLNSLQPAYAEVAAALKAQYASLRAEPPGHE